MDLHIHIIVTLYPQTCSKISKWSSSSRENSQNFVSIENWIDHFLCKIFGIVGYPFGPIQSNLNPTRISGLKMRWCSLLITVHPYSWMDSYCPLRRAIVTTQPLSYFKGEWLTPKGCGKLKSEKGWKLEYSRKLFDFWILP